MDMGDDAFRQMQRHMCLGMIEEQCEADIGNRFFGKLDLEVLGAKFEIAVNLGHLLLKFHWNCI